MTTYMDINKTIESLAFLGFSNYHDSIKNSYIGIKTKFNRKQHTKNLFFFKVNRSKLVDIEEKKTFRNCFLCYVYGTRKCGKTAFLQGLLKRDLQVNTF
jgi:hypothetical protein